MKTEKWTINLINQAKKAPKTLPRNVLAAFFVLLQELEVFGPFRHTWPNYSKIKGSNNLHCHLKKGHPTFVACWYVKDQNKKIIEIYYVGTHEKAPY